MKTAAPKDRSYLEQLNFKQLQKGKKPDGENPKVFYKKLQEDAKSGPVFDTKVLETVSDLPELPKPVTKWIANLAIKDQLDDIKPQELGLIIDWVRQSDNGGAEISNMSWDEAVKSQKEWHDSKFQVQDTGEYKTNDVVMDVGGGYKIVQINDCDDLVTEGDLMGHCVGGDDYCEAIKRGTSIYSLRDSSNKPHVTMEVNKNDEMLQCFGKQNETPVPKYHPYLTAFFRREMFVAGYDLLDLEIPDEVVEEVIESGGPGNIHDLAKATKSEDVMLRLATVRNPDAKTLKALVYNENCTPKVCKQVFDTAKKFSKTDASDVFLALTDSSECPVEVLAAIPSMTANKHVLRGVLRNHNTPKATLDEYVDDETLLVAENRNTSSETLEKIVAMDFADEDEREDILCLIAKHKKASEELLTELSKDKNANIRGIVAKNQNTPLEVLEVLAEDPSNYVRQQVKKNINTPFELSDSIRSVDKWK